MEKYKDNLNYYKKIKKHYYKKIKKKQSAY